MLVKRIKKTGKKVWKIIYTYMIDRFFNLFSSPSGMFENEESYIFLQNEQRKNNCLTHKMEYW